jgi:hypothetical protein
VFNESATPVTTPDKKSLLKAALDKYNFKQVDALKHIPENTQNNLYEILASIKIPFQIALLHELGFIEFLKKNYVNSDVKLFKKLAEILETNERIVKGNIYVLKPYSNENRNRYTAHQHIAEAKDILAKLK